MAHHQVATEKAADTTTNTQTDSVFLALAAACSVEVDLSAVAQAAHTNRRRLIDSQTLALALAGKLTPLPTSHN